MLPIIPLVIRGQVITDHPVQHTARHGGLSFVAPDPQAHLRDLVLQDGALLADAHALRTDEVVDYLVELGRHLSPAVNEHMDRARTLSHASAPTAESIVDEQYRMLPALFERALLEDMLDTGIDRAALDGWVWTTLRSGRKVGVRAYGSRCVHINAGNSPVMAALAIIRNALTRGDAIIKSPSNDPLTAAAIAQTMCEFAPDHPLTRHASVAYWPGGDERVERTLYTPQNIEKIVAWGGFASIKHVTQYLQPGLELVSFDPKRSASVIGAEAFRDAASLDEVAGRLAVDIGQLNQAACANARVVYVVSGTGDTGRHRLDALGERVYRALLELPPNISTPARRGLDPALREQIEALRDVEDWYRVIGGHDAQGAVVLSRLSEPVDFAAALCDRVANLVPVDDLTAATAHFDAYTQTVGVWPESLKDELRELSGLSGAQRLVSLGYACAPTFAGPQDALEPLRRLCRWVVDERADPSLHPLGDIFVAGASRAGHGSSQPITEGAAPWH